VSDDHAGGETGPGIIETLTVVGLSILLGIAIVVFFGGALAGVVAILVDAAHGGS